MNKRGIVGSVNTEQCGQYGQYGRKDSMDRRNFLKTPVSKAADSSPLILLPPKSGK